MPLKHFTSLIKQRYVFRPGSHWKVDGPSVTDRMIHYGTTSSYVYMLGRHQYVPQPGQPEVALRATNPDGFIAKWAWTPWPEQVGRKIEMGRRISPGDKSQGLAIHRTTAFLTGSKSLAEKRRGWTRSPDLHTLD